MKKFFLFLILLLPINVFALDYPKLNSKYVMVYDLTDDNVLYEIDSDKETAIASLTKIATTITAIESIENLNDEVEITRNILSTVDPVASTAGLKEGDKLTYLDLLYASMLPSGADATNSLAILTSGSIENFVSKMNSLANRIGLNNTHFVNVTGLDEEGHYSTIKDINNLLTYSLKNETFKKIFTTKEYTLSNGLTVYTTLKKYNKNLNLDLSKIIGSKTGFTYDAGYCLATLSNIDNHEIVIINLNAPYQTGVSYHLIDNVTLINFIDKNYSDEVISTKDSFVKTIPVKFSNIKSYDIKTSSDVSYYLAKDYNKDLVEIKYEGKEKLNFLDKKGSKIGKILYYYDSKIINEEDVYLNQNISINKMIPIIGVIVLIGLVIIIRRK